MGNVAARGNEKSRRFRDAIFNDMGVHKEGFGSLGQCGSDRGVVRGMLVLG